MTDQAVLEQPNTQDPATDAPVAVESPEAAQAVEAALDATAETAASAESLASSDAASSNAASSPVRGMAVMGKHAQVTPAGDLPAWPAPYSPEEMYVPQVGADVVDLLAINRMLLDAKARIFRVSHELKRAQRAHADAVLEYDRAYRRALVSVSGGSAETRKALAEIECEPLENRKVIAAQLVEEWKRRSTDCRDDLKAIENLSHNVRAQIQSFES